MFKLTGIIPPERAGTPIGLIFTIWSLSALISQDLLMIGALIMGIPYLAYIIYLLPVGLAVLSIFVGLGLWKLQKRARTIAITWAVLGVVLSIASIALGIGYYLLFSKEAKSAFK